MTESMLYSEEKEGFDIFSLVDTAGKRSWFDDYLVERLSRHPMKRLRRLPIWDKEFCDAYDLIDKRTLVDKCIHKYAYVTRFKSNCLIVRAIDKILKILYK